MYELKPHIIYTIYTHNVYQVTKQPYTVYKVAYRPLP